LLTVKIIAVGRLREKYYIGAFDEYLKRLSAFCKIECLELSEKRVGGDENKIQSALLFEGETILKHIPKGAYVISMCVEGRAMSSEDFAHMLGSLALEGYSKLCFIIGGSHGLSEEVKRLSCLKLSMSGMTFPHHLARVMLAEQIYRGFMINENTKYHK